MRNPLVSISCITYNHAPYIRECLEGFLMQKCDFAYEILIHDDASTDGTQEIIKEYQAKYPDIIKPILQTENQYSKGIKGMNLKFNFPRAKGKYIALCEGDDYWTDPLKLQKQVDFLESNPQYILSCHNYKILHFDGKTIKNEYEYEFVKNKEIIEIDEEVYLSHWITKTPTVVLLNDPQIFEELNNMKHIRDLSVYYEFIRQGKGVFQNFNGAIYRKQKKGVYSSQTKLEAEMESLTILEELYEKYNSIHLFNRIQKVKYSIYYFENKYSSDVKKIPIKEILNLKIGLRKKIILILSLLYNNLKKIIQ